MQSSNQKCAINRKLKGRLKKVNKNLTTSKSHNKLLATRAPQNRLFLDLESPNSVLAHADLKAVINEETLTLLSPEKQMQLIRLLPACDRTLGPNGVRAATKAFNNEFFTEACCDWRRRLADGEFTADSKLMRKLEQDKERARIDPWKLKHFESVWGEKLQQSSCTDWSEPEGNCVNSDSFSSTSQSTLLSSSHSLLSTDRLLADRLPADRLSAQSASNDKQFSCFGSKASLHSSHNSVSQTAVSLKQTQASKKTVALTATPAPAVAVNQTPVPQLAINADVLAALLRLSSTQAGDVVNKLRAEPILSRPSTGSTGTSIAAPIPWTLNDFLALTAARAQLPAVTSSVNVPSAVLPVPVFPAFSQPVMPTTVLTPLCQSAAAVAMTSSSPVRVRQPCSKPMSVHCSSPSVSCSSTAQSHKRTGSNDTAGVNVYCPPAAKRPMFDITIDPQLNRSLQLQLLGTSLSSVAMATSTLMPAIATQSAAFLPGIFGGNQTVTSLRHGVGLLRPATPDVRHSVARPPSVSAPQTLFSIPVHGLAPSSAACQPSFVLLQSPETRTVRPAAPAQYLVMPSLSNAQIVYIVNDALASSVVGTGLPVTTTTIPGLPSANIAACNRVSTPANFIIGSGSQTSTSGTQLFTGLPLMTVATGNHVVTSSSVAANKRLVTIGNHAVSAPSIPLRPDSIVRAAPINPSIQLTFQPRLHQPTSIPAARQPLPLTTGLSVGNELRLPLSQFLLSLVGSKPLNTRPNGSVTALPGSTPAAPVVRPPICVGHIPSVVTPVVMSTSGIRATSSPASSSAMNHDILRNILCRPAGHNVSIPAPVSSTVPLIRGSSNHLYVVSMVPTSSGALQLSLVTSNMSVLRTVAPTTSLGLSLAGRTLVAPAALTVGGIAARTPAAMASRVETPVPLSNHQYMFTLPQFAKTIAGAVVTSTRRVATTNTISTATVSTATTQAGVTNSVRMCTKCGAPCMDLGIAGLTSKLCTTCLILA